MKKNGYTVVELMIVLIVFSVGYFASVIAICGKISFNFEQELYNEKISSIEKQASIYANAEENLFSEDNTVYVTIGDLVEKNVIISNKNGEVVDPRNNDTNLNDVKIKLEKKEDFVVAKALN